MAKLNKTSSDYVVPKIRESFMQKFIYQTDEFFTSDSSESWMQPSLKDPNVRLDILVSDRSKHDLNTEALIG